MAVKELWKIPEKPECLTDFEWEMEVRSIRRFRAVVVMGVLSVVFSLGSIAITLMRMLR